MSNKDEVIDFGTAVLRGLLASKAKSDQEAALAKVVATDVSASLGCPTNQQVTEQCLEGKDVEMSRKVRYTEEELNEAKIAHNTRPHKYASVLAKIQEKVRSREVLTECDIESMLAESLEENKRSMVASNENQATEFAASFLLDMVEGKLKSGEKAIPDIDKLFGDLPHQGGREKLQIKEKSMAIDKTREHLNKQIQAIEKDITRTEERINEMEHKLAAERADLYCYKASLNGLHLAMREMNK